MAAQVVEPGNYLAGVLAVAVAAPEAQAVVRPAAILQFKAQ